MCNEVKWVQQCRELVGARGTKEGKKSSFSLPVRPVPSKAVPLVKTKLMYCDTLSKIGALP